MTKSILIVALTLTLSSSLHADTVAETGRKLLAKHKTGVLALEIQLRQSVTVGAQEQKGETKVTTCGVLLDASGLIAISLSAVDPSSLQKAGNPNARNLKIESEVVDAKVVLVDSTEIPVEVVYRDKDLDLAFVRTKKPLPGSVIAFDLSKAGKADILDEAYVLYQLGAIANRTIVIQFGRILGSVDKPRPYYLYEHANLQLTLGSPVLAQDGKLIGLVLMRFDTSVGGSRGALPVVVPTEDIKEAIDQAREAAKKKAAEPQ